MQLIRFFARSKVVLIRALIILFQYLCFIGVHFCLKIINFYCVYTRAFQVRFCWNWFTSINWSRRSFQLQNKFIKIDVLGLNKILQVCFTNYTRALLFSFPLNLVITNSMKLRHNLYVNLFHSSVTPYPICFFNKKIRPFNKKSSSRIEQNLKIWNRIVL